MPDPIRESQADRESRILLTRFLTITDPLLERMLQRLILDRHRSSNEIGLHLRRIWASARESLKRVIQSIGIGLSRARRAALNRVGMFGEILAAKFELLAFDIREGAVKRVLKRLNSMSSSLAGVFIALDVVREFKDCERI
jgi:hypothetical protein